MQFSGTKETAQTVETARAEVRYQLAWIIKKWGGVWITTHDPKHSAAVDNMRAALAEATVRAEALRVGQ